MYDEIKATGGELLVVSVESQAQIKAGREEMKLSFPMLSDVSVTTSDDYGVYNLLGDRLAAPSVFIINRQQQIVWKHVGRDILDRPSAKKVLAELKKAAG